VEPLRQRLLSLAIRVAKLTRSVSLALLGLGSSLTLGGCFGNLTPATATMAGLSAPVLLGPVDRVGGGKPLATKTLREFEATSRHLQTHSESGGYSIDTEIAESSLAPEAEYAVRGSDYKDIRLTEVKPQAVGWFVGVKARVDVEGDVVQVTPNKAATK
jgi:hypothetical protein